jgi:hypothetical protein
MANKYVEETIVQKKKNSQIAAVLQEYRDVHFFTLTSCKIFTVVKVQAVVISTVNSHNKRCSALKKQVICFLETLVNTHQTTSCHILQEHNKSISLFSLAIYRCDSANHWS